MTQTLSKLDELKRKLAEAREAKALSSEPLGLINFAILFSRSERLRSLDIYQDNCAIETLRVLAGQYQLNNEPVNTVASRLPRFAITGGNWERLAKVLEPTRDSNFGSTMNARASQAVASAFIEAAVRLSTYNGTLNMENHEILKVKIASLQEELLKDTPQLPNILQQIRVYIAKNPDTPMILTEEEIGTIVAGCSKQADINIVTNVTRAKSNKKALKNTDIEDMM